MTYAQTDRKAPAVLAALAVAQVFRKQGEVKARPATDGEQIETILGSGVKETTNSAGKTAHWAHFSVGGFLFYNFIFSAQNLRSDTYGLGV